MTYFPDLSPYTHLPLPGVTDEYVNVGWLDKDYPFPTGPTPDALSDRLLEGLAHPRNRTRGYHLCNLCGAREPTRVALAEDTVILGDAEIHIADSGRVYASPNLIIHYVSEHSYRPPDEFVLATLKGRRDAR
jgi:hypothetical protein